eukprot:CAMPEP_0172619570 /NCGR_PEP_ID=MMETSP1068-20121228/94500_1 /TAXON_ID=35684 /ORGANISM="Pseudopedinella elastica, Strain CCMP716" /LENGTH=54 /DNA_ID=CAMNT_0013426373 /DNA_START=239 /DNA_END=399 /DNA_ORIENTATION=-
MTSRRKSLRTPEEKPGLGGTSRARTLRSRRDPPLAPPGPTSGRATPHRAGAGAR